MPSKPCSCDQFFHSCENQCVMECRAVGIFCCFDDCHIFSPDVEIWQVWKKLKEKNKVLICSLILFLFLFHIYSGHELAKILLFWSDSNCWFLFIWSVFRGSNGYWWAFLICLYYNLKVKTWNFKRQRSAQNGLIQRLPFNRICKNWFSG